MSGPINGTTDSGDRIVTNDADEVIYWRDSDGDVIIDESDSNDPIKY